jgi:hypothetical protein
MVSHPEYNCAKETPVHGVICVKQHKTAGTFLCLLLAFGLTWVTNDPLKQANKIS